MYPRMENIANPETKLVTQLMVLVRRASLGKEALLVSSSHLAFP